MSKSLEVLAKTLEKYVSEYGDLKAFAKKVGVSENSIARYKKGKSEPSLDVVDAIAKALGMESWQLIKPDEKPLSVQKRAFIRLVRLSNEDQLAPLFDILRSLHALDQSILDDAAAEDKPHRKAGHK